LKKKKKQKNKHPKKHNKKKKKKKKNKKHPNNQTHQKKKKNTPTKTKTKPTNTKKQKKPQKRGSFLSQHNATPGGDTGCPGCKAQWAKTSWKSWEKREGFLLGGDYKGQKKVRSHYRQSGAAVHRQRAFFDEKLRGIGRKCSQPSRGQRGKYRAIETKKIG